MYDGDVPQDSPKRENVNWVWPDVKTFAGAKRAARYGFWIALFGAVITGLFATVSIFTKAPFFSITPWAFADMAIFGLIAWRVYKFSPTWSVLGLIFFLFEKIAMAVDTGKIPQVWILIYIFMYVQGVRGCFGIAKLNRIYGLAMSDISVDNEVKKCPQCAETIKLEAIKCRFCNYEFDPQEVAESVNKKKNEIKRRAGINMTTA